jgi:hypothetical protein
MMPPPRPLSRACAAIIAPALLATALTGCGTSAQGASDTAGTLDSAARAAQASASGTSSITGPACGSAAPMVLAKTIGQAAMQIYAGERSSTGVSADKNQVESFEPLLSALASGSQASVKQAVTRLVYSGTHIVRLRVTRGGVLLADVGGPYILAPVGGNLRFHGRSVGRYLLSVQDDLGYVKLETRYIGVPLVLYGGSRRVPLEGALAPGPQSIPDLGPVHYRGASYEAFSFNAEAFPRGPLRISLLVPLTGSLSHSSCAAIKISALGHIAQRVWHRFSLAGASPSAYVHSSQALTGSLSYVRSGAHQLAGSTQPGPARIPGQGSVSYRGVNYGVSSFAATTAAGPARVYLLVR